MQLKAEEGHRVCFLEVFPEGVVVIFTLGSLWQALWSLPLMGTCLSTGFETWTIDLRCRHRQRRLYALLACRRRLLGWRILHCGLRRSASSMDWKWRRRSKICWRGNSLTLHKWAKGEHAWWTIPIRQNALDYGCTVTDLHVWFCVFAPKTPHGSLLSNLIYMVVEPELADEPMRLAKWMEDWLFHWHCLTSSSHFFLLLLFFIMPPVNTFT